MMNLLTTMFRGWRPDMFRLLPVLLGFWSYANLLASPSRASEQLNVLLIISDDLNTALGCYGNRIVQTPNIDALAARGLRFANAHCQYPLCGPSRNSLLTGRQPNSTGLYDSRFTFRKTLPTAVSLPQAFRLGGWFTGRVGKIYHANVPRSIGTDGIDDPASWEWKSNPAGCDRLEDEDDIYSVVPGDFGASLSWLASSQEDALHTDGMVASDAIWMLKRQAQDRTRPFFLAVGFYRPHTPYVAPASYFDAYAAADMPVVQNIAEDRADIPEAALMSRKAVEEGLGDEQRREAVRAYYASISFVDAQVGQVMTALDQLGLADSTIVVFTSDHGYHLGEHGLWQKRSLFEAATHVPLIIAPPQYARGGSVSEEPVGLIDLYPTLAALCSVTADPAVQGQSLVPLLDAPDALGRGAVITQIVRQKAGIDYSGYSMRGRRWRYTEWGRDADKGRELYDHDRDPGELINLADDSGHAETVAALSQELAALVAASFPPSGHAPAVDPNEKVNIPDLTGR